jgi:cytochrome oxidase Cu insertion factor (SCO1/SenC/PrrC family)
LIQNGFYQTVEDNHGKQLEPGQYLVTHSTRVVLVDENGVMRGFYDGLSEDGRKTLLDAIHQLERE